MTVTLFALALFATPPPDAPQSLTAGQLYDGCVRFVAHAPPGQTSLDATAQAYCDLISVAELVAAQIDSASDAGGAAAADRASLPDSIIGAAETDPIARAFIAYVEAHPGVRGAGADEVFARAMAEKWPCRP